MLTLSPSVRVYLSTQAVDLRRGHDGLAAWVRQQWSEALYRWLVFFIDERAPEQGDVWQTKAK